MLVFSRCVLVVPTLYSCCVFAGSVGKGGQTSCAGSFEESRETVSMTWDPGRPLWQTTTCSPVGVGQRISVFQFLRFFQDLKIARSVPSCSPPPLPPHSSSSFSSSTTATAAAAAATTTTTTTSSMPTTTTKTTSSSSSFSFSPLPLLFIVVLLLLVLRHLVFPCPSVYRLALDIYILSCDGQHEADPHAQTGG